MSGHNVTGVVLRLFYELFIPRVMSTDVFVSADIHVHRKMYIGRQIGECEHWTAVQIDTETSLCLSANVYRLPVSTHCHISHVTRATHIRHTHRILCPTDLQ